MKKKSLPGSWLLITAGLGSSDFEESAIRVGHGAKYFSPISEVIVLNTESTFQLCTEVQKTYPQYFKKDTRGFGFMAWKAEVVHKAIHGHFGNYSGVIWVDGGCEIFPSAFSEFTLTKYLKRAEKMGVYTFTIDTPEYMYTKKFLLQKYMRVEGIRESPQIQTTWFALHGEIGRAVATDWLARTLEDFRNLDLTESPGGEDSDFVENRYDQSIFSLVCKEKKIMSSSTFCVSGRNGLLSLLKASFYPIWASRNRTGRTIIPKLMFYSGIFSLRIKHIILRVKN